MQFESLDRYEIVREWGRSAVGRVLLARDPDSGTDVAIQLVETLSAIDEEQRGRLSAELQRAAGAVVGLRHANIVAVLDIGEAEGLPYVVTEQTEGTPFSTYCRPDSLLPPWTVLDLVAGIARGLDEVHRLGVVHGDLRPENLLRVDDAGMVAAVGLSACLPLAAGAGIRGASAYLSPEQIRGETSDARSDVFALGSVLYEMLTGRKAFPGESLSTVIFRIVNEEVADPKELDPPLVAPLADTILRALAKRPEDRFQSAADLAAALVEAGIALRVDDSIAVEENRQVADESAVPAPSPGAGPRSRRSPVQPFVLGALLLALVAVAVFSTLNGRREAPPVEIPWLETRVSTEPPGLPVLLDGEPVELGERGTMRFRGQQPFGVLSVSHECRTAEHPLDPADAGGELVLVIDPVELEVPVDPAIDGAQVLLNGETAGTTPADLKLDLCRDNKLELRARGYHTAAVEIPSGANPLDARKLVYALTLEKIPRGKLVLPKKKGLQLVYYVDGKRIKQSVRELELDEGEHELRFKNEYHWIDQRQKLRVDGGKTTTPSVDPQFATLAVQAFPSNCKVFLRRPGGSWRYLDETPAERRVAIGAYEVKVQLNPTGETRVSKLELEEGANPPVRVAFGASR
jgi:hypothetical protein